LSESGLPEFSRETLQLGDAPIFIAGDANAAWPLLHEAADDGRLAGQNAAAYPEVSQWQRRAPMAVVFTDPQVARAGLAYRQLPENRAVTGYVSFENQGRSRVMLKNKGALRLYAHVPDGRLLGAEMAGPAMEHIAHLLAWSVQQKLTIAQMLDMPFYHPVIEEGLRTALRDAARNLAQAQLECVECERAAVNAS
jgi:dihydrolipoamide dehydrogenase